MNMTKKKRLTVTMTAATLLALNLTILVLAAPCRACFSIVVGKEASADGYVIMAHNEDDSPPQIVNHHKIPRRSYQPGDKVTLRNGGQLDQVEHTWAYLWSEMPGMLFSDSYINEWGVSVTSDNCPSREDKPRITDGGIGYMLRRLVAERARTAREGVRLAGKLVGRFGYRDSGRTYIICDPEEGWLFCVVNGKHWLAQRVGDDEVAMVANTYTVRRIDLSDTDSFLASSDIIDYAVARGWYDPEEDGAFDFAAAYANPGAAANPSNFGRQWNGLRYIASEPMPLGPDLPFSMVPRHKVGVTEIMQILRHDRDQPQLQLACPAEALPPAGCRICRGATQTSFAVQLRRDMPLNIGIVYWVCLAPPGTSVYIPFHFGISDFPAGYAGRSQRPSEALFNRKVTSPFRANPGQTFWTFSNFRDKVRGSSADAIAQVRARAEAIEKSAMTLQKPVEDAAGRQYSSNRTAAMRLLANYSKGIYLSALEAMDGVLTAERQLSKRARELAHRCIIIDTHQDVPYRLTQNAEDISKRTEGGDFDYPRAKEGSLDAVFMAVYVPAEYEEQGGAKAFADETIDMIESWTETWPDKFVMAESPAEIRTQFGRGKISIAMGIENGAPIEGDLANLKHFYDRGIRYITLAHSKNNHICDSSYDEKPKWHGLSPFGKQVVAEMNRLGMIIDVSHVTDAAFYQVVELSKAPVVATHSSCRHFTPGWERNMDDDMIRLLAKNGGLIQINFGSMFVNTQVNKRYLGGSKHMAEHIKAKGLKGDRRKEYVRRYRAEHPIGDADISDVVAHIDHVVKLVGVDYVGLGSDFDGVGGRLPNGLRDVSCYPNLVCELLRKGYSEKDIRKICGGNFLRVWSNVQNGVGQTAK